MPLKWQQVLYLEISQNFLAWISWRSLHVFFYLPASLTVTLSLCLSPLHTLDEREAKWREDFHRHTHIPSSSPLPLTQCYSETFRHNWEPQPELWSCNKFTDQLLSQLKLHLLTNDLPTSMKRILLISCRVWEMTLMRIWINSNVNVLPYKDICQISKWSWTTEGKIWSTTCFKSFTCAGRNKERKKVTTNICILLYVINIFTNITR